jgi:two-component system heavy metal sensor histidine kinase CusS
MKLSFKKRIATYNLIAIATLMAIAFLSIYIVVYFTSYQHLDDDITVEKEEVFNNLDWHGDKIIMNKMPEWEEAEHKQLEVNPTFLQIVDLNGKTIFKSANLQKNLFLFNPNVEKTTFYNAVINDQKIRQGQFPVFNDDNKIIGQLTIGVSQQESYNVLHNLLIVLCLTFVFILSILYFIMYFVASKAIAPIYSLINSASKINYSNINSRLTLPDHEDEIHQLATTINELINRLEISFHQQKQFTSDASHEMQTPLAAIKGIIEVLIRKPRTQEQYESKLKEVLVQTDRLSLLFDQLLQLARLESTTLFTQKTPVLLDALIDKISQRYGSLIQKNKLTFNNQLPQNCIVKADEVMLERILDNLISNAIKYNIPKGSILCIWDNATNSLIIKDNGIGIPKDQLPFLFNRFYRADNSRSSVVSGNGLGLSIVRRLCDIQNILITVDSAVGESTTFTLQFKL